MIAIDVLLEPDEALLERARRANALLRGDHPAGFAFDDTHLPHATLVQRYVREHDLDAVCWAIGRIASARDVRAMRLQVTGLNIRTAEAVGTASWAIAATPELQQLADDCLVALAPFAASGGDAAAFVPNEDGTPIRDSTVRYVERFAAEHSGADFAPHVTLGLARVAFLQALEGAAFEPFAFHPAALAIHQLGNHGTARRRLWRWPPA